MSQAYEADQEANDLAWQNKFQEMFFPMAFLIILFGDEFAELASISPQKTRFLALLSCCLITGAVTAFCGPIGFVGITAPHIARGFWKTSAHRTIIPASLLCGGTIGVAADLLSYTASIPIPISSTMAIAGVPVILYILVKQTGSEL